jgi:UDP-glucose 4-epimerase
MGLAGKMAEALRSRNHILVTGGAGFIGSHLVERLLRDGKRIVVIDDLSTGVAENLLAVQDKPELRIIRGKVSECAELDTMVAEAESVYHLAAGVGVELVVRFPVRVLQANLHETEVLLEAAARHGTPVLLTSTSEVYGKSQKSEFTEEDDLLIGPPHQSRWSYACSKLMDEFLALAYAREQNLPVVIARLFNTVGPRQTGRFGMVLPRFLAAARCGEPLKVHGDGNQTRCFCYVLDTVEALVRLQNTPACRGEVFNIGSTEEVTIKELAETVLWVLRSRSAVELLPYAQAYEPGFDDMRRRKPSVRKLAAVVGFQPKTTLEEIIRLTAELLA